MPTSLLLLPAAERGTGLLPANYDAPVTAAQIQASFVAAAVPGSLQTANYKSFLNAVAKSWVANTADGWDRFMFWTQAVAQNTQAVLQRGLFQLTGYTWANGLGLTDATVKAKIADYQAKGIITATNGGEIYAAYTGNATSATMNPQTPSGNTPVSVSNPSVLVPTATAPTRVGGSNDYVLGKQQPDGTWRVVAERLHEQFSDGSEKVYGWEQISMYRTLDELQNPGVLAMWLPARSILYLDQLSGAQLSDLTSTVTLPVDPTSLTPPPSIYAPPNSTVDAPVRPDASLPTQGPINNVTTVPAPSSGPTVAPPLLSTAGTPTTTPNPASALGTIKWGIVVVIAVTILALAASRRK